MLNKVKRLMKSLRRNISGNAMILLALGMPAMIGGAGLAIDTAQWYMWQRELQYAVDEAALAGAWARTQTATETTYVSRALQEYNASMQTVDAFDTGPTTTLVNYGAGTNNAVRVVASATKRLPFSSFLTDQSVTVSVSATASVTQAVAGTSTTVTIPARSACLIALNPSTSGALKVAGSTAGTASCGGAALSSHPTAAIDELGNPDLIFGSLTATGGIASSLVNNVTGGTANMFANQQGLSNPFAGIAQPTGNGVARSYPASCPTASAAVTKATTTPTTMVSYIYVTANNKNNAENYAAAGTNTYTGTMSSPYRRAAVNTVGTTTNNVTVPDGTTNGNVDGAPTYADQGTTTTSGVREVKKTILRTTYSNVAVTPATTSTVTLLPGTYPSINMNCDTNFSPGIYVVTGGMDFSNNRTITGTDVMFVLTTNISIGNVNSNTNITLTGISAATLTDTYGYSSTVAAKLARMLFWDTQSTGQIKFNGNSSMALNGIIYTPKRNLDFQGNTSVTGYCMMLVADTLTFSGSSDFKTFCQTAGSSVPEVRAVNSTTTTTAAVAAQVRLVS